MAFNDQKKPFKGRHKTELCRNWRDGYCKFENNCKWLHGENDPLRQSETQQDPTPTPSKRTLKEKKKANKKSTPVAEYSESQREKLRLQKLKKMQKINTRPCKFYVITGECRLGDQCTFRHSIGGPEVPTPDLTSIAAQQTSVLQQAATSQVLPKPQMMELQPEAVLSPSLITNNNG